MKFNWIIALGVLLVIGAIFGAVYAYQQTHSPLDNPASGEPVEDGNFISLLTQSDAGTAPAFESGSTEIVQGSDQNPGQPDQSGNLPAENQPAMEVTPEGMIPDRMVIPSIHLDALVVPTHYRKVNFEGQLYLQWIVPPQYAVGWHDTSALLGLPGNTVFNGHHNVYGEVFGDLVFLMDGDLIEVYSGSTRFVYRVATLMILPERNQDIDARLKNSQWISQSNDERITLVTCWPKESSTHRLIVVAFREIQD